MHVSVVVPTYNRRALLRETLAALSRQDYREYEVIVVDDGSVDGTREVVQREFPEAHYVRLDRNRGCAAARNAGVQAARGEIVAFTDDDCVPPPDWLSRLAEGHVNHPEVVGVGGYMEPTEPMLRSNAFARYEAYLTHVVYGAGHDEYVGGYECPAGGTNNISYKKAVLEQFGGFDESFPAGADPELKWRICGSGHRLLYVPSCVLHQRPYTWSAFRDQQILRGRGALHFERKHKRMPSRLRLLLRVCKRGLTFWPDLLRLGASVAWVKLWAGWLQCWGQWLEMGRLQDPQPRRKHVR